MNYVVCRLTEETCWLHSICEFLMSRFRQQQMWTMATDFCNLSWWCYVCLSASMQSTDWKWWKRTCCFGGTTLSSLDSYIQKPLLHILHRKWPKKKNHLVVGKMLKMRWSQELHLRCGEYVNSWMQTGHTSSIATQSNQCFLPWP